MAFSGCLLKNTADQNAVNISAGTTNLTFSAEVYDTDSYHSTVSNTERITIPSAVNNKYGIFTCCLLITNLNGADLYGFIRLNKNGSDIYIVQYGTLGGTSGTNTQVLNLTTPPLLLATNDIYTMRPQSQDTSVNIIAADTSFGMFVVGT